MSKSKIDSSQVDQQRNIQDSKISSKVLMITSLYLEQIKWVTSLSTQVNYIMELLSIKWLNNNNRNNNNKQEIQEIGWIHIICTLV